MASQPYLGAIFMFGGNFAPRGYQLCQGQLLSISQNAALFSILGTTYGGNGTTTFGLPNLQGRFPLGQGTSGLGTFVLGESAGINQVTLLSNNMPIHNHLINVSTAAGAQNSPQNNYLAQTSDSDGNLYPTYNSSATGGATLAPAAIGTAGGNVPFSIQNPFVCINFIIAIVGIFPTRN